MSKLRVKRRDGLLLAVFYAVVGVSQIVVFVLSSYTFMPPHVGALAVLSMIAAYGLLRARKWAVWLVIILFFPQLVFGSISLDATITLYTLLPDFTVLLMNILLGIFLALTFMSLVYIAARRKTFQ
jgi:uncharacterized membrane protein (DUF2068 family)